MCLSLASGCPLAAYPPDVGMTLHTRGATGSEARTASLSSSRVIGVEHATPRAQQSSSAQERRH
jgi:hypothetical protein